MRLFVSIELPGRVREKLHGWLPDHHGLRYTKQEQLHLTLLFLGECDEEEGKWVIDKLKTVHFNPFQMTIHGVGAFPSQKNPRVIWAGVEKNSELINLHSQVKDKLSAFASESSARVFKPHITLARTTAGSEIKKTDRLFKTDETLSVKVESISLKRSILSDRGSSHTTLGKFTAETGIA